MASANVAAFAVSELNYGSEFTETLEILTNDDLINNTHDNIIEMLNILVSRKHKVPYTLYQLKYIEKILKHNLMVDEYYKKYTPQQLEFLNKLPSIFGNHELKQFNIDQHYPIPGYEHRYFVMAPIDPQVAFIYEYIGPDDNDYEMVPIDWVTGNTGHVNVTLYDEDNFPNTVAIYSAIVCAYTGESIPKTGDVTDHRDQNPMDCRLKNLEVKTSQDNAENTHDTFQVLPRHDLPNDFKRVTIEKRTGKRNKDACITITKLVNKKIVKQPRTYTELFEDGEWYYSNSTHMLFRYVNDDKTMCKVFIPYPNPHTNKEYFTIPNKEIYPHKIPYYDNKGKLQYKYINNVCVFTTKDIRRYDNGYSDKYDTECCLMDSGNVIAYVPIDSYKTTSRGVKTLKVADILDYFNKKYGDIVFTAMYRDYGSNDFYIKSYMQYYKLISYDGKFTIGGKPYNPSKFYASNENKDE